MVTTLISLCTAASAKKTAKVMFDYEATQADELTIKVDDIVEIVSEEEPGWCVVKYMCYWNSENGLIQYTHPVLKFEQVYNFCNRYYNYP